MRKPSRKHIESRHVTGAGISDYFGKASSRSGKGEKVCTGHNLAKCLSVVKLSEAESVAWQNDLKIARKNLKPQMVRWP